MWPNWVGLSGLSGKVLKQVSSDISGHESLCNRSLHLIVSQCLGCTICLFCVHAPREEYMVKCAQQHLHMLISTKCRMIACTAACKFKRNACSYYEDGEKHFADKLGPHACSSRIVHWDNGGDMLQVGINIVAFGSISRVTAQKGLCSRTLIRVRCALCLSLERHWAGT